MNTVRQAQMITHLLGGSFRRLKYIFWLRFKANKLLIRPLQ